MYLESNVTVILLEARLKELALSCSKLLSVKINAVNA